jgi:hypothetical protein
MKKKIELDEETARMLDEVRGDLSRSEYVDRLLKTASRCHTVSYARTPQ